MYMSTVTTYSNLNSRSYSIADLDLYLDINTKEDRKYVLRVKDLPQHDQPREKMLDLGARSLSAPELLAIVLSSGTKKEDVLHMSHKIIKEYGEGILSQHIDPKKMSDELDIPLIKAMQVVAIAELGRRYYDKNAGGNTVIRTPKDAYEYLKDMHNLPKEHVRGIYLNTHHQVIHDEVITIGTVNSNIIHPREVFRPALQYGAAGVILAHNHPSGVLEPSLSDIEVTRQLVEAGKVLGISLIDHIIVTAKSFTSIDVDYSV